MKPTLGDALEYTKSKVYNSEKKSDEIKTRDAAVENMKARTKEKEQKIREEHIKGEQERKDKEKAQKEEEERKREYEARQSKPRSRRNPSRERRSRTKTPSPVKTPNVFTRFANAANTVANVATRVVKATANAATTSYKKGGKRTHKNKRN